MRVLDTTISSSMAEGYRSGALRRRSRSTREFYIGLRYSTELDPFKHRLHSGWWPTLRTFAWLRARRHIATSDPVVSLGQARPTPKSPEAITTRQFAPHHGPGQHARIPASNLSTLMKGVRDTRKLVMMTHVPPTTPTLTPRPCSRRRCAPRSRPVTCV